MHVLFFKLATLSLLAAVILTSAAPLSASAASSSKKGETKSTKEASGKLEVSGWIPYWRTDAGTRDASAHLSQLTEVNPFGYTVKADGTLNDAANIQSRAWQDLFKAAKAKKVRVIPTVMWSDTDAIHKVLSDPKKRAAHIQSIVKAVNDNGFDGIDIDYEGKKAETRTYYSAFLKELAAEFGKKKSNKWLMCTIEARMPLEARFSGTPPANIEYANDFKEINTYCDRVRVMTYDQQTADLQLNAAARAANEAYAPVADVKWVEKVINYMAKDIDKKKMSIGIATYGYIYQLMPYTDGSGFNYIKTEAFNPAYATDIAAKYGITPTRNRAGELSFTYVPKEQVSALPNQGFLAALAPRGTTSGNLAAAGALALAKKDKKQAPVQLLWWSDAKAIGDKVALAKKLKVAGVSVFKFDGGSDPKMWDYLK
ncbi:MAG: spore peptidoglycan hydrolase (N-acetylglucosaminidase) [Parcubacteria bacterium C7867-004]|nr:MAG: spore peptidoglycan hydrolase (N-acetylglucosaminidase) [Parcubacteria bacterium C7867-004]